MLTNDIVFKFKHYLYLILTITLIVYTTLGFYIDEIINIACALYTFKCFFMYYATIIYTIFYKIIYYIFLLVYYALFFAFKFVLFVYKFLYTMYNVYSDFDKPHHIITLIETKNFLYYG